MTEHNSETVGMLELETPRDRRFGYGSLYFSERHVLLCAETSYPYFQTEDCLAQILATKRRKNGKGSQKRRKTCRI